MDRHIEVIACPEYETGPGNQRNSEGSIIELSDGRLYMVYSNFTQGPRDFAVSDIQGRISEDGGRTWSKPFLVQPNDARTCVMIGSLLRLAPCGRGDRSVVAAGLGLFYVKHETLYTGGIYFRLSRDEGANWSKELRINDVPTWANLTMRNDSPIQHSSGRIIVPVQASFGGLHGSFMYFSDDEGNTWQRSENELLIRERMPDGYPAFYSYFNEPSIVELRDGSIMVFGRNPMGRIYKAFSKDRGNTWSDPGPTDLATSLSPCSLKRIPSTGDLLCIWNQVTAEEIEKWHGRCRMSCAISKDEGDTWEHFKNLESLNDVSRIEPPPLGVAADTASEEHAKQNRVVLWGESVVELDSELYPKKGYPHVDYPACTFTRDDHVVISYGVYGGQKFGLTNGNKVVIHPVGWLYDD